jgi:NADH dehydrogenase FAD-containing subunit
LRNGEMLRWDIVSFNVGSVTSTDGIDGAVHATPAKPISGLCELRHKLEETHAAHGRIDAVVIGGGATGCEIALNLRGLAHRRHWEATVTLVCDGLPLIEDFPAGAQTWMRTTLAERGVRIVEGRVSRIDDNVVTMTSGERVSMHAAILATGLRAPLLMMSLGLPASSNGLHVNQYLHSPVAPRVFAVGDCAQFLPSPLPYLGLFGVRQAPILLHNLTATLRGRALRAYRPQSRYLTILNAGDGTALARWGQFWWQGTSAMKLKEYLDLRFLEKYRH